MSGVELVSKGSLLLFNAVTESRTLGRQGKKLTPYREQASSFSYAGGPPHFGQVYLGAFVQQKIEDGHDRLQSGKNNRHPAQKPDC